MQPLREPRIDVERHGAMREFADRRLVERHRVKHQALEILLAELHFGRPQHLALGMSGPKLKAT